MGLAEIDKDLRVGVPGADMGGTFEGEGQRPGVGPKPIAVPPTDTIEWLRQYVQGSRELANQDPIHGTLNKYTPSLPTALSLLIPGSGVGGAAMRIGAVGAAHGGEAALEGRSPVAPAVEGMAAQAIPEALPVVGPVAKFGATMLPGAGARATRASTAATNRLIDQLAQMGKSNPVVPTANESWGKFFPTGLPAKPPSQILAPSGQPAIPAVPAVPPQIITHPRLRGWTMGDVIEPLPKAATSTGPTRMRGFEILRRLLGAGGQETVTQANE
jgi:hypothetical protein